MNHSCTVSSAIVLPACLLLSGCATVPRVSYQQDVRPILANKCIACHTPPDGQGYRRSGLDMESYETLMEGSIYGPAVIPGNSRTSPLVILVENRAGGLSRAMKYLHMPITGHEIMVLRTWVEEGAQNN